VQNPRPPPAVAAAAAAAGAPLRGPRTHHRWAPHLDACVTILEALAAVPRLAVDVLDRDALVLRTATDADRPAAVNQGARTRECVESSVQGRRQKDGRGAEACAGEGDK